MNHKILLLLIMLSFYPLNANLHNSDIIAGLSIGICSGAFAKLLITSSILHVCAEKLAYMLGETSNDIENIAASTVGLGATYLLMPQVTFNQKEMFHNLKNISILSIATLSSHCTLKLLRKFTPLKKWLPSRYSLSNAALTLLGSYVMIHYTKNHLYR